MIRCSNSDVQGEATVLLVCGMMYKIKIKKYISIYIYIYLYIYIYWAVLLNVCDLLALRQHCMRNHHATLMKVVTWDWEYSGKLLSATASKKNNLKLCYVRRKLYTSIIVTHRDPNKQ